MDYPKEWREYSGVARKRAWSLVVLLILAILCIAAATAMWRSDDGALRALAKYMAVFGLAMVAIVAMGASPTLTTRRPTGIVVTEIRGRAATVVPGSASSFVSYQMIWTCFGLMFLGGAVEIAGVAWRTHWPLTAVFAVLGVFCLSGPILAVFGRLRRGRIVLTAEQIVYEGWSSRVQIPWSDVLRVGPAYEQIPLISITGVTGARWSEDSTPPTLPFGIDPRPLWSLDKASHNGVIRLELRKFAVDPHRLYRFLVYYADHPDTRGELGGAGSQARWESVL
ncbi:hypothetical protein IU449_05640 [Nocardia higoensis]|uniref:PH domain-containing protein n=1 Tax=Nocardia higoensis TaxID=228599 RepID=A0ABS0D6D3_9NOCA|nr:hypothetical protein [Nocardia higoensis]MBF6354038.1 hypothetical protein [Nocardia higoensis]